MSSLNTNLLKVSAVLWVIWGLVHLFAGIMTISLDTSAAVAGIADAIDPETLVADYAPAVGALVNQHGWNLGWGGIVTVIGAIFIWKGNMTAIWVTAMVGGLLDLGYLLYIDLPGFANFVPGTVMTIISATAIILSFYVWLPARSKP